MISNNQIKATIALAVLQNVMDPEIGLNIVDLGLIYQIDFDDTKSRIYCAMTLTTRFCPMGESITNAVEANLKAAFPDYKPLIELTFEPSWNHNMISEAGKQFLNEK